MASDRDININHGNYNENIAGNYIDINNSPNSIVISSPVGFNDLSGILDQLADFKNLQTNQIKYGKKLIEEEKFTTALDYFLNLEQQLWSTAKEDLKYKIWAYIGLANYGLDNLTEAANYFIKALRYRDPDNDQGLALAAFGYELVNDYDQAKSYAEQAIQLNPGNSIANGLIIRVNTDNSTLEELTNLIPSLYRDDVNVLAALGNAALDKDKLAQAEEYFKQALKVSKGNNNNRLKLALSYILLKPFTSKVPLFLIGQFDSYKQKKLEQAVELLTDILDNINPSPDRISKIQLDAIINRSGAYWLLDKRKESIRDIEIALQTNSENSQLVRQYANLLYRSENTERAISELKKIAVDLQNPDAALDLANLLVEHNSFQEAEELLNKIIEQDLELERKSKAQQIKIFLYRKSDKLSEAKLLCEEIIKQEPNNIINITQYIYVISSINSNDPQIEQLFNFCKDSVDINDLDLVSLYYLALLYHDFKHYHDAAIIYEKLADTTLDNELTERLVYAYFCSGNLKSALSLSEQILERSGDNLSIAEMTSCIYEQTGDLNKARQVCESVLKYFPDNVPIRLRLAVIHRRTHNFDDLDSFLDSDVSIDDLTLNGCTELIRLYKIRNKLQRAAEILYQTRRRFYQKSWVHVYYFASYITGISSIPGEFNFPSVINNCGVLLKDQFDQEIWYIVDDIPDYKSNRNEINSQHNLYNKLIGKKIGDEIVIRKGFHGKGEKTKTIIAITDKYFAARRQSEKIIEESDELEDFLSLKIPNVEEINEQSESFILYSQTIQNNESHFKELYSYYSVGKFAFGTLAKVANNQNPIDLWLNLAFKQDYSIFCYRNPRESFESAFANLEKGGRIIVDVISLLTLYHLKIADEAIKALGKFGISQSTFDLFNQLIHKLQEQTCNEYIFINISMGYPLPDEPAQLKAHFEQFVEWIINNCHILTSDKALDLNKETKDERNKAIGASFVDTILLASEPNCILLSEDQLVRDLAYSESGIRGVWSQIVLSYCYIHNHIDLSKYFDAYLNLINWGYEFLSMDIDLLIEGAKRANWKSQKPYTTLLEYLSISQATEDYLTSVATDFIYKLYTTKDKDINILPHYRDMLIFELLKSITNKRSQNSILRQLIPKIKQKFYLSSLIYEEILQLIELWWDCQTVKT